MDGFSQVPARENMIAGFTEHSIVRVSRGYLPHLTVMTFQHIFCPSPAELAEFERRIYEVVPNQPSSPIKRVE